MRYPTTINNTNLVETDVSDRGDTDIVCSNASCDAHANPLPRLLGSRLRNGDLTHDERLRNLGKKYLEVAEIQKAKSLQLSS